jgi:uncharacterized membrane protein
MNRKVFVFELLMIAAALAVTIVLWPHLQGQVTTHWNLQGQPDGHGARWELFLMGPGFMGAWMLMTWLFPWLSPKRFGMDSFWSTYRRVMAMMFCLIVYAYTVVLWEGLGHAVDGSRAILGGVCLFTVLAGNLMGKVRQNFFIGVRTPWTLASERVWNATHRFAARTFVAGGLAGLVLSFLGIGMYPVIALLGGMLAPVAYSLVIYKQLERRGEL